MSTERENFEAWAVSQGLGYQLDVMRWEWKAYRAGATQSAKELEGLRAEVEQLKLAEEGAKTAFAHVVDQKREIEAECTKSRRLLDDAYADIRRLHRAAMSGKEGQK